MTDQHTDGAAGGDGERPDPSRYAKRINRMLEILTLAQHSVRTGQKYTPAALAERYGVAERTIYRDLDEIKKSGIPIDFDKGEGTYRIGDGWFMPPVHLAPDEALAMTALCEHIGEREQIPFLEPASRALHKIAMQLPASVREAVEEQRERLSIRTAAAMEPEGHGDVYAAVQLSLATSRVLACRYESIDSSKVDKETFFDMRPLALFFSVRAWYVIGERLETEEADGAPIDLDRVRCFKLARFTKCSPTERVFRLPAPGFDLDAYLGNAWRMMRGKDVDVEIHFDAQFAHTASDTLWHKTQTTEDQPDGSCIFRCTVSGLDEIVWWVLSMGPHCRIVKPAALAERVRALAAGTAAIYQD
ncbi:MAG: helix-turn-helix transcriptional regulator [Planctomycetota bacterium]